TRAARSGDGWRLTGAKAVVQHGEHADWLVVSARTAGANDAPAGISLFLVPAGTPGITVRGYPKVDGGRAADLVLEDVVVPASALLGTEAEGFAAIETAVGRGVLALCAESVGAMDMVKAMTLVYLQTRQQ